MLGKTVENSDYVLIFAGYPILLVLFQVDSLECHNEIKVPSQKLKIYVTLSTYVRALLRERINNMKTN